MVCGACESGGGWLAAGLVDDGAEEVVGVSTEVGAGGNHGDGGLGEFGGLPGVVVEGVDQDRGGIAVMTPAIAVVGWCRTRGVSRMRG